MTRSRLLFVAAATGCLALGFVAGPNLFSTPSSPFDSVTGVQPVHLQWASDADAVVEQLIEADVVVRARVVENLAPRKLVFPLAENDPWRTEVNVFTDSVLEVLEVYQGTVGDRITVMQTGGAVPATAQHPGVDLQVADDPLFVPGSEHVLFLVDISGDPVHAPERRLYRTVNPAGRYLVEGRRVVSHPELGRIAERPGSLDELETEIAIAREELRRMPIVR